jgi:hypothetical protein
VEWPVVRRERERGRRGEIGDGRSVWEEKWERGKRGRMDSTPDEILSAAIVM